MPFLNLVKRYGSIPSPKFLQELGTLLVKPGLKAVRISLIIRDCLLLSYFRTFACLQKRQPFGAFYSDVRRGKCCLLFC